MAILKACCELASLHVSLNDNNCTKIAAPGGSGGTRFVGSRTVYFDWDRQGSTKRTCRDARLESVMRSEAELGEDDVREAERHPWPPESLRWIRIVHDVHLIKFI
jgi:hypothetical protein